MKVLYSCWISDTDKINIYDIVNGADDYVLAGLNDLKPRKYKIYGSSEGSYFTIIRKKMYLSDFLKVD